MSHRPHLLADAPLAAGSDTAAAARAQRGLRALWLASALGGGAMSLTGPAGGLLGRDIAGSDAVVGLPPAVMVAGAAVSALALARLTRTRSRRTALSAGAAAAGAGCGVAVVGAVLASLLLLLVGSCLLGAGNAAVMLSRYAAADLGPDTARARAMATLLAATTVGAVAGPNLLGPTSAAAATMGLPPLTGPYLLAAVGFAAATITLAAGLDGAAPRATPDTPTGALGQPPAAAAVDSRGAAGIAVLTLANLVMVSLMTMTAVHLRHAGTGLGVIGLVVSLHVAGMFGPSPASGWLTGRVGATRASAVGGAVLVAACVAASLGAGSTAAVTAAMVLLGVGWNVSLVAGSTLLTADVQPGLRPRREAWGEVGMGAAAAGGGAAAGPVVSAAGYSVLAAIVAAAALSLVLLAAVRVSGYPGRGGARVHPAPVPGDHV